MKNNKNEKQDNFDLKTFREEVKSEIRGLGALVEQTNHHMEAIAEVVGPMMEEMITLKNKVDTGFEKVNRTLDSHSEILESHSKILDSHTEMIGSMMLDITEVKTDVSVLKTDVSVLKKDVSVLKTDVSVLKKDMTEVKNGMKKKVDTEEFETLEHRVSLLERRRVVA